MRNRFDQQLRLGVKLISETPVPLKSRDETPALILALKKIFCTPSYSNRIFELLEKSIGNSKTGRKGMDYWKIFVLAEFRLALDIDYDKLHYISMTDKALRQLLGIESETGFEQKNISYQNIVDNVQLLDDEILKKINLLIVEMGHQVFKKKEEEALDLKTDSYVLESNVHFPTDYNLLWDSLKKAIDSLQWFKKNTNISDWRKVEAWYKTLKNLSKSVGRISSLGGKNKEKRLESIVEQYLRKARKLQKKIAKTDLKCEGDVKSLAKEIELTKYVKLIDKHIDLLERRVIKGEKIPHQEKLFSIFEQYTEWITKGKKRPSVELGKMVSITTDQYNLIVDYQILENSKDSQIVKETVDRVCQNYKVSSWSFDKGYWHKDNKTHIEEKGIKAIMPKKGKRNKAEKEEETSKEFKKLKNKHSAIESNINELEHRGLNRCPDRGYTAFKRYAAIGIIAYNLHKIGKEIQKQELKKEVELRKRRLKRAA